MRTLHSHRCNVRVQFFSQLVFLCLLLAGFAGAQEADPKKVTLLIDQLKNPSADSRGEAADALKALGEAAKEAVPQLIEALKDHDSDVRWKSADALRQIGKGTKASVPQLIDALKSPDKEVRWRIADTLGRTGAKEAVPQLIDTLNDPDSSVRMSAAIALGEIGEEAKTAVPQLIKLLRSDNRWGAARALAGIGEGAKEALPELLAVLKNDGEGSVRAAAAEAVGSIRAKEALPHLIAALQTDRDKFVRSNAALALAQCGDDADDVIDPLKTALGDPDFQVQTSAVEALEKFGVKVVPHLIEALKDHRLEGIARYALAELGAASKPQLLAALHDPDAGVRSGAADVLGRIRAKDAEPQLIAALKDPDRRVRGDAALALGYIEAKDAVPQLVVALKDPEAQVARGAAISLDSLSTIVARERATQLRGQLTTAAAIMRNSSDPELQRHADRVQQAGELLDLLWWEQLKQWIVNHPTISLSMAAYPLLFLTWIIVLWLRPLWLLRINDALEKTTSIKLPEWLLGINVAPRYLILVGFFHYRSRVLDAWVAKYSDTIRRKFSSLPTVAEREIYVPLPVVLGNGAEAELSPDKLRPIFSSNIICLQVWGEGGSGKTTLTCRLARWAMASEREARLNAEHLMLPVLIEQDLVIQDKDPEHPLLKAIKQQVKFMTDEDEPPPTGLLQQLLKRRRVLVVIDGFSEMNQASRMAALGGVADLPTNAVIITTRTDEQLTGISKTEIKPLRVRGNRLSTFMEAYLTARKKRDLFEDDEFFESCRRLSLIVRDRDVTALLAKLYAEQMIAVKENATDGDAPETIPELMLSYLNDLCRDAGPDEPDIRVVHRAAKSVAWECLKKTFKPQPAQRGYVLSALGGEEKGEQLLEYLEKNLKVVQTVGAGRDQIRFALDPLAEYLAGMHLVAENGEDEDAWRGFLAKVDEQEGAPEEIKGFLLALRDCCLAKGERSEGLRNVADELAQRVGISSDESDRYKIERRVRQLILRLKSAEVVDRVTAAGELASFGIQAKKAVKDLCVLMRDPNDAVRSAATVALGVVGQGTKEVMPYLIVALKDPHVDVRRNAAYALGRSGLAKEAMPQLVESLNDPDERVRKRIVEALEEIGLDAKGDRASASRDIEGYI